MVNNDQFTVKQLGRLAPDSFDEFRTLLPAVGEAIMFVYSYRFNTGVDIAIWQMMEDKTVQRTVMASGPIDDSPRTDFSKVKISHDETIPRWTRIKQALALKENEEASTYPTALPKWVINNTSTVDLAEFQEIKNIVDSLATGCTTLLGSELPACWVVYKENKSLRCLAESSGGQIEPVKYFNGIGSIRSIAGIPKLPVQCLWDEKEATEKGV